MMKITFQTALITGSSRGIGRKIAVKLAQEGVENIAIHYHSNRDEAEKTLALIRQTGADGILIQGDTANVDEAEDIVQAAVQQLDGCDIFVQSVVPRMEKIYEHVSATEVPLDKWQLAFDTQARAFFVGARAAAKSMTKGGRIIALSYTMGAQTGSWQPWVGMGPAKAALDSMCKYFAVDLGCQGITVNSVSPGVSDPSSH